MDLIVSVVAVERVLVWFAVKVLLIKSRSCVPHCYLCCERVFFLQAGVLTAATHAKEIIAEVAVHGLSVEGTHMIISDD